jgi:hypothetical protein
MVVHLINPSTTIGLSYGYGNSSIERSRRHRGVERCYSQVMAMVIITTTSK